MSGLQALASCTRFSDQRCVLQLPDSAACLSDIPPACPPASQSSTLRLVDLAASEGLRRAEQQQHSQEAGLLNQSLTHLKQVMELHARGERVPTYRNSRLTQRLQDSLGGNSRLLVLACVTSAQHALPGAGRPWCMIRGGRGRAALLWFSCSWVVVGCC